MRGFSRSRPLRNPSSPSPRPSPDETASPPSGTSPRDPRRSDKASPAPTPATAPAASQSLTSWLPFRPISNFFATTFASSSSSSAAATTTTAAAAPPPPPPPSSVSASASATATTTASSSQALRRIIADFHISPDVSYSKYTPGDKVYGSVCLTIVKPLRITHLVVALHGSVRVFPTTVEGARAKTKSLPALAPSGPTTEPLYHGGGQASLFQDEQVLAGEGRLEPRQYVFKFELHFPKRPLPSSIDFERGHILYTISATLTRPTSKHAAISCYRSIPLEEKRDIGVLPPPGRQTISVAPKLKKSRRKKPLPRAAPDNADADAASDREAELGVPARAEGSAAVSRAGSDLGNDAQSVRSGGSARSGSTRSASTQAALGHPGGLPLSCGDSAGQDPDVAVTVELLQGGCRPGDTVPVRVSVQLDRVVKSMHGIIATLYREAKINQSWTATKKSRGFRKDLSQSVVPLIIDPVTLQTAVVLHLRVPEDSFPTVTCVPGDMISFRYQIEVIADLGGRLAKRFVTGGGGPPGEVNPFHTIDTRTIKRESGVVEANLEVVVGALSSSSPSPKREQKRPAIQWVQPVSTVQGQAAAAAAESALGIANNDDDGDDVIQPEQPDALPRQPTLRQPRNSPGDSQSAQQFPQPASQVMTRLPAYYPPPPQLPDESTLTEKQRIQLAEQRLLPSQPPPNGAPVPDDALLGATAPPDFIVDSPAGLSTSGSNRPESETAPVPVPRYSASSIASPSAPSAFPTHDPAVAGEDKQELQRRRLLAEASAPPDMPDDAGGDGANAAPRAEDLVPTAPVLEEGAVFDDEYVVWTRGEMLPRYERYEGGDGQGGDEGR